jgi:3-oxoacyl-[acyl-carrier-protein] synthase-3
VLTNNDLAKLVDTNDEWIVTRTGIQQRHVLAEGETLSQHAATASQNALKMAGVNADQIDLILMATSSPDDAFGNACSVSGLCGCDARAFCNASLVALVSAS